MVSSTCCISLLTTTLQCYYKYVTKIWNTISSDSSYLTDRKSLTLLLSVFPQLYVKRVWLNDILPIPIESLYSHGSNINHSFVISRIILKSRLTQQCIPKHLSSTVQLRLGSAGSPRRTGQAENEREKKLFLKIITTY